MNIGVNDKYNTMCENWWTCNNDGLWGPDVNSKVDVKAKAYIEQKNKFMTIKGPHYNNNKDLSIHAPTYFDFVIHFSYY